MACVKIERYTPVTLDLNANQPKIKAKIPGTNIIKKRWIIIESAKYHMVGISPEPTTPNI